MNATDSKGSHLYICILPGEQDALESYRLLQKNGFSPANVAIVGKGAVQTMSGSRNLKRPLRRERKARRYSQVLSVCFPELFSTK
jgi:hypothetical protein